VERETKAGEGGEEEGRGGREGKGAMKEGEEWEGLSFVLLTFVLQFFFSSKRFLFSLLFFIVLHCFFFYNHIKGLILFIFPI